MAFAINAVREPDETYSLQLVEEVLLDLTVELKVVAVGSRLPYEWVVAYGHEFCCPVVTEEAPRG